MVPSTCSPGCVGGEGGARNTLAARSWAGPGPGLHHCTLWQLARLAGDGGKRVPTHPSPSKGRPLGVALGRGSGSTAQLVREGSEVEGLWLLRWLRGQGPGLGPAPGDSLPVCALAGRTGWAGAVHLGLQAVPTSQPGPGALSHRLALGRRWVCFAFVGTKGEGSRVGTRAGERAAEGGSQDDRALG